MKQTDGLLPCPFCGSLAEYHQFANPKNFYGVRCTACHCGTDGFRNNRCDDSASENKARQAEIWNRRPHENEQLDASGRQRGTCGVTKLPCIGCQPVCGSEWEPPEEGAKR